MDRTDFRQPATPGVAGARGGRWPAHYSVLLLLLAAVFISYIDRTNISVGAIAMQAQLGWRELDKGRVLAAFYVGYMLLMPLVGALCNRFGGRMVLGLAVLWWSLFTALTPPAALRSLDALIAARIALGVGEAAVFPASINMIGRWVPVPQRSRAVALALGTASLSSVFALPLTGFLIRAWGWPLPFYLFGAAGVLWAAAWFAAVKSGRGEKPAEAGPRVIPWRRLLATPAVWAIILTNFCFNWSFYVLSAWLPSYIKSTFAVSLANASVLAAAPWLASFTMATFAGVLADALLRSGWRTTRVRRLMQCTGLTLGGLCLVGVSAATTLGAALALICCAAGAFGLCFAGYAPNGLDIAPRHADVIWALSNTTGTLPGIFGVYVTGWLVDRTASFSVPFYVTAAVSLLGAVLYWLLGSGERQIE